MASAYSNDLRRKFLRAYEKGKGSLTKLANDFEVSVGWAKKISATRTRTGEIDRAPWRRGPGSKVTAEIQQWLRELVCQKPDTTLREMREQLQKAKGLSVSIGRLWLALNQMGLRLKKSHSMPRSKTRPKPGSGAKLGGKKSGRSTRTNSCSWMKVQHART
jgi:transposase